MFTSDNSGELVRVSYSGDGTGKLEVVQGQGNTAAPAGSSGLSSGAIAGIALGAAAAVLLLALMAVRWFRKRTAQAPGSSRKRDAAEPEFGAAMS